MPIKLLTFFKKYGWKFIDKEVIISISDKLQIVEVEFMEIKNKDTLETYLSTTTGTTLVSGRDYGQMFKGSEIRCNYYPKDNKLEFIIIREGVVSLQCGTNIEKMTIVNIVAKTPREKEIRVIDKFSNPKRFAEEIKALYY